MGYKLNLGAGVDIRPGWLNADLVPLPGIEAVFDMNVMPWPWMDNTFDQVEARHVLEHSKDLIPVLEELWRVCQHGALVHVEAPHFAYSRAAWDDPTHRSPMGPMTMQYFAPGHPFGYYSKARFVTTFVGHSELYLAWDMLAYKQHDPEMLARQVDASRWREAWEKGMALPPSEGWVCRFCGRRNDL